MTNPSKRAIQKECLTLMKSMINLQQNKTNSSLKLTSLRDFNLKSVKSKITFIMLICHRRMKPSQEEIDIEAKWILDRLEQEKMKNLSQNAQVVTKKIAQVLQLFRVEFMDIPMIMKYRKYVYAKDLDESDIYTIFRLD